MTDQPTPSAPDAARDRPRPSPTGSADAPPPSAVADESPVAEADSASTPDGEDEAPARRTPKHAGLIALIAGILAVVVAVVLVVLLVRDNGSGNAAQPSASAATQGSTNAELSNESQAQGFVAGATADVAAVTSYGYRTLSSDLANGEAVSIGAYRTRYQAALTGSLGTTAKKLHRTQSFSLAVAGIGAINAKGDEAHVLMFGTQDVQDDTTKGKTVQTPITLDVTVLEQGGAYYISDVSAGTNAGLPPGTPALSDAAEAAREEVAALLTRRRAHLDADYNAALALAVEPLRTALMSQASGLAREVTKGKYDLTGAVTAVAVHDASGDTVTMLVAATGTRTTAAGKSSVATDGRYEVTVVRVQGRWYVSEVTPVTSS